MSKQFQSNALWPAGVCSSKYGDNISTDQHTTRAEAMCTCELLSVDGFGGDRQNFPIATWVSDVQDPPVLPPHLASLTARNLYNPKYVQLAAAVDRLASGISDALDATWVNDIRELLVRDVQCSQLEVSIQTAADNLAQMSACLTAHQTTEADNRAQIQQLAPYKRRLDGLRELMGHVQDGSSVTVRLSQDDATNEYCLHAGREHWYDPSFEAVIDKATAGG